MKGCVSGENEKSGMKSKDRDVWEGKSDIFVDISLCMKTLKLYIL